MNRGMPDPNLWMTYTLVTTRCWGRRYAAADADASSPARRRAVFSDSTRPVPQRSPAAPEQLDQQSDSAPAAASEALTGVDGVVASRCRSAAGSRRPRRGVAARRGAARRSTRACRAAGPRRVGAGPAGGSLARDAVASSTALGERRQQDEEAPARRRGRAGSTAAAAGRRSAAHQCVTIGILLSRILPRTGVRSNARTTVYQNRRTEVEHFEGDTPEESRTDV